MWCTSEFESPVSWASDFSDLTCAASRSRARNSFCNDVPTWSATGYPLLVVIFDTLVQWPWFHVQFKGGGPTNRSMIFPLREAKLCTAPMLRAYRFRSKQGC